MRAFLAVLVVLGAVLLPSSALSFPVRFRLLGTTENPHLHFDSVGSGNVSWSGFHLGPWSWDGDSWLSVWHDLPAVPGGQQQLVIADQCGPDDWVASTHFTGYEVAGGWEVVFYWPLSYPTATWTVQWVNQLTGSRLVVVDVQVLDAANRVLYQTRDTFYATTQKPSYTLSAPCQGTRLLMRLSPWAKSIDPNGPDEILPGAWSDVSAVDGVWTVVVSLPFGADYQGFNVGDKVALRSIPDILAGLRGDVQQVLLGMAHSQGGGATNVQTVLESMLLQRDADVPTNDVPGMIGSVFGSLQPYINGAVFQAVSNSVGDFTAPVRAGMVVDVSPGVSPPSDWEITIFGRTYSLSPRELLNGILPGYYGVLVWALWLAAAIGWGYWVAVELYTLVQNAGQAATMASVSLAGSTGVLGVLLKKAGLILELVVLGLIVWLLVMFQGAVLVVLFGGDVPVLGTVTPAAFGADTQAAWAKVWRMANHTLPLSLLLALAVNTVLAKLWLTGLLSLLYVTTFAASRMAGLVRLLAFITWAAHADWALHNTGTNAALVINTQEEWWQYVAPGARANFPAGWYHLNWGSSAANWSGRLDDGDVVSPVFYGEGSYISVDLLRENRLATWSYVVGVVGVILLTWWLLHMLRRAFRATVEESA